MEFITKDITTVEDGMILHGVNCQGKMGSGVAKAIRAKWPYVYDRYKSLCDQVDDGSMLLGYAQFSQVSENLYVVNCFTQVYYGYDNRKYADAQAIGRCLGQALNYSKTQVHKQIYMPPIGCGLGGLDWETDVKPIVAELEEKFGETVIICDI